MEALFGSASTSFWDSTFERTPLHLTQPATMLSSPGVVLEHEDASLLAQLLPLSSLDAVLQHGAAVRHGETERQPWRNMHDISLVRRVQRRGDASSGNAGDEEWFTAKWGEENATIPTETLRRGFNHGFTLLIDDVQERVPAVARLCDALENVTLFPCNANAYLSPPGARAFELHFDSMDVVVLQLEGRKQWRLHPPLTTLPRPGLKFKPRAAFIQSLPAPIEFEMNAGDRLYLPRGWLHEASTPADTVQSLHVTVGWLIGDLTYEGFLHDRIDSVVTSAAPAAQGAAECAEDDRSVAVMHAAVRSVAARADSEALRRALPMHRELGSTAARDGLAEALSLVDGALSSAEGAFEAACSWSEAAASTANDAKDKWRLPDAWCHPAGTRTSLRWDWAGLRPLLLADGLDASLQSFVERAASSVADRQRRRRTHLSWHTPPQAPRTDS